MGVYDVAVDVPVDELLACNENDVGNLLKLDAVVGKGGFATVWRAFFDGHLCACKILQPRGGGLPPAPIVRLFIRECLSLVTMEHSAVIRCFGLIKLRRADVPELGLTYDTYGMLLEFCEGGTLKDLLMAQLVHCKDHYTVREAVAWLAQVASALHQFHSLGMPIIHRDIKPENILLQIEEVHDEEAIAAADDANKHRRSGGGGGAAAARQRVWCLQAKLADLGLGVRVCTDRSVLVRRRTTPMVGESEPASAEAPPVEDEGGEVPMGRIAGGSGAAAAAAAASTAAADGRLPFMGFTTRPLQPLLSKRQGSDRRISARTPSLGGGGSASLTRVSGSTSPLPPCSSIPAERTLHQATLLNSIRTRISARVDSITSRVSSAMASPAMATPRSVPPEDSDPRPRTNGSHDDPGHIDTSPHVHPPPRPDGGEGGGAGRSGDAGPSPFRDYMMQHSSSTGVIFGTDTEAAAATDAVQRSDGANPDPDGACAEAPSTPRSPGVVPPPSTATLTGVDAGDGLPAPTAAASSQGHLPPVAASALALEYTKSLGHPPGHGTAGPVLPPISERSLSAEDATFGSCICEGGDGTAMCSTTATTVTALGSVSTAQPSTARASAGGGNKSPLYVMQEPDDASPPPLPTASAPYALTSCASNSTAAATDGGAASHNVLASTAASILHTFQKVLPVSPGRSRAPSPLGRGAATADASAVSTAHERTASCPHVPPGSSSPRPSPGPGCNGSNTQSPTVNRHSESIAGAGRDSSVVVVGGPTMTGTLAGPGGSTSTSVGNVGAGAAPTATRSPQCTETSTASPASRSSFLRGEVTISPLVSALPSRDTASLVVSGLLRPNLRELSHADSIARAMRKIGSLLRSLNKASLPKFRPDSEFQWVYALTGQAGSCMYMAPEVFRGEPYNEKVDVYSFGVMMYELLSRDLLLVKYVSGSSRAGLELGVKDPKQYARKVCEGFRPPRHPRIPETIWQLIQRCWHQDPLVRPDMAEVQTRLEAAFLEWNWQHQPKYVKGGATKPHISDSPAGPAPYGKDPDQASQPQQRRQAKQKAAPRKQLLVSNSSKEQAGGTAKELPGPAAVGLVEAAEGVGGCGEKGEEERAGAPEKQRPGCCVIC